MTNVEYRCPQCNGRLFAAAGGTRMRCPKCDEKYVQTEAFHGEDKFAFKDEKGEVHVTNPDERAISTMDRSEAKDYLKEQYKLLSGGRTLDGRMSVDDMLEEVQKLRNEKDPLQVDQTGIEA